MNPVDLTRFQDLTFDVEVIMQAPPLKVDRLLALGRDSVVLTGRPAGDSVQVLAGKALLGSGELGCSGDKAIVWMLSMGTEE
jgi:flagellar motor switch/type III secretory pathway protein FliN